MSGADYYRKYPARWRKQRDAYREKNKEKIKQWARDSYHRRKKDIDNIQYRLWRNAKQRAREKGLAFTITKEDINIPSHCPVFKIPFVDGDRRLSPSIDRIDCSKGYTRDNIQIISQLANAMKWDSTPSELLQFAKWVLEKEGNVAYAS